MYVCSAREFSCYHTSVEPRLGLIYRSGIRFKLILVFLITQIITKKRLDELGRTKDIDTNEETIL